MTDLTERAQRILDLQAKATPGLYDVFPPASVTYRSHVDSSGPNVLFHPVFAGADDARFIATAHESADLIRELLAEIERLRTQAQEKGDMT